MVFADYVLTAAEAADMREGRLRAIASNVKNRSVLALVFHGLGRRKLRPAAASQEQRLLLAAPAFPRLRRQGRRHGAARPSCTRFDAMHCACSPRRVAALLLPFPVHR